MVEQSQNPASDPGAQRRRSTRIVQAIPLTVTGEDALGQPFRERTSTLIVNCHGCRYQSKHYVPKSAFINIEVPHPDPAREPRRVRARVTWIQRPRTVRELFQVGAELEVAGNCWGVAFPPDDWFPWPDQEGPEIPALDAAGAEIASAPQPSAPVSATPAVSPTPPPALAPAALETARPPAAKAQPPAPEPAPPSATADKVRVMTRPSAGAEVTAALARQMARLMAEAKQQIAQAVRLTATQVITAETRQVMGDLTSQLRSAAESAVEEAATAQADKESERHAAKMQETLRIVLGKIEESREASLHTIAETREGSTRIIAEEAQKEIERTAVAAAQSQETLRQMLAHIEETREAAARTIGEQSQKEVERANDAGARTEDTLRQALQRIEESREAGLSAVAEQAQKEIERTIQAGERTEAGLQQTLQRIEESREAGLRAVTEQARLEVQRVAEMAIAELSGRIAATGAELREHAAREVETGRSQLAALEAELASAVSGAGQRGQIEIENRIQAARHRLEELTDEAGQVEAKIGEAVERNRLAWREKLEGDIAIVGSEWNELVATSIRTSTEGLASRLAAQAQTAVSEAQRSFTTQVETQLSAARAALDSLEAESAKALGVIRETTSETNASSERVLAELRQQTDLTAASARETVDALRQAFDASAAEARRTVDALRDSLESDAQRAEGIMAEIQEAATRVQDYSTQLEQLSKSTAEEMQRRFETVLVTQSEELSQRAEHLVSEMTARLAPTFEEAGQRSVEKFLREMEEHLQQKLTPQFERVTDALGRLAAGEERAEATMRSVRERLREAADQYVHEAVSRMQGTITQLEHDYQESSRQALARLTAELDEKATETTHTTFEGLYKASEWYQKKAQTSMQSALERAVEHASATLREKAGEMSSLFATELDHYSRSYTEHTEGLLEESSKKIMDATRVHLEEAAATTLAGLGDEAVRVADQQLKHLETAGELTSQKLFEGMEARAQQTETLVGESIGRIDARANENVARIERALGRMDARATETETRAGESLTRIEMGADQAAERLAKSLAALETTAGEMRAADEAAMIAARERLAAEAEESFAGFQTRVAERMVQGVSQAQQDLQISLQPIIERWRDEREAQHREWLAQLQQLGDQALDQHQNRLANVSNSWMATSVTALSEHSQTVLDQLAQAAEQRLRETCAQVFSGLGDTLRQRMLGLSADLAPKVPPIIPPQNPDKNL